MDLEDPTSDSRKRNWRFRFVMSIVSRSITSTFGMLDMARSLRISHPNPPAPTTNTRDLASGEVEFTFSIAVNSPIPHAPVSFANGDARLNNVAREPRFSLYNTLMITAMDDGRRKMEDERIEY